MSSFLNCVYLTIHNLTKKLSPQTFHSLAWEDSWANQCGSNAIYSTSIPKSLFPLLTRKSPSIPHFGPYEFLTIQYLVSVFSSLPHPMITTEWFMSIHEMPLSLSEISLNLEFAFDLFYDILVVGVFLWWCFSAPTFSSDLSSVDDPV